MIRCIAVNALVVTALAMVCHPASAQGDLVPADCQAWKANRYANVLDGVVIRMLATNENAIPEARRCLIEMRGDQSNWGRVYQHQLDRGAACKTEQEQGRVKTRCIYATIRFLSDPDLGRVPAIRAYWTIEFNGQGGDWPLDGLEVDYGIGLSGLTDPAE
ncbi:MAG: hypothetical protein Alpg2KO_20750 [Alphaproteobacteria bacterium]